CRRVELEAVELDGDGHALVPAGEVTDAGFQVALADVAPRADDIGPHVDSEGLAHAPSVVGSGRNPTPGSDRRRRLFVLLQLEKPIPRLEDHVGGDDPASPDDCHRPVRGAAADEVVGDVRLHEIHPLPDQKQILDQCRLVGVVDRQAEQAAGRLVGSDDEGRPALAQDLGVLRLLDGGHQPGGGVEDAMVSVVRTAVESLLTATTTPLAEATLARLRTDSRVQSPTTAVKPSAVASPAVVASHSTTTTFSG